MTAQIVVTQQNTPFGQDSGTARMGIDKSHHLYTQNAEGVIWTPSLQTSLTSAVTGITNSPGPTILSLPIPIGLIQVGTSFRITVAGVFTGTIAGSGGQVLSFYIYKSGETAATAISFRSASNYGTGTSIPYTITACVTMTSVGTAATMGSGFAVTQSQGTTGAVNSVSTVDSYQIKTPFNSLTANLLEVGMDGGINRSYDVNSATLEVLSP